MRNQEKDFWDILFGDGSPLGPTRRPLILVTVGAGLLVFLLPLITTSPPVLAKTRWSLVDIAWHVYQAELPASHSLSVSHVLWLLDPLAIGALLIGVLWAVFSPNLQKRLAMIALWGLFLTLEMWWWDDSHFEIMFYGHVIYGPGISLIRRVGSGQLELALLLVFGAILFVAVQEDLDPAPEREKQSKIAAASGDRKEPEFIDVEILEPEKKKLSPRDKTPRLHG